jgi:putative NADH-flavin reductase
MKAFVAGATGQTGRRIIPELGQRKISVLALVRNLNQAKAILLPDAEIFVGDVLNRDSLKQALGEGSIPHVKVAQLCVEAVFNPQAKQKIKLLTNYLPALALKP